MDPFLCSAVWVLTFVLPKTNILLKERAIASKECAAPGPLFYVVKTVCWKQQRKRNEENCPRVSHSKQNKIKKRIKKKNIRILYYRVIQVYVCHPSTIMGHMEHNNCYLTYSNNMDLIKNRISLLDRVFSFKHNRNKASTDLYLR